MRGDHHQRLPDALHTLPAQVWRHAGEHLAAAVVEGVAQSRCRFTAIGRNAVNTDFQVNTLKYPERAEGIEANEVRGVV